MIKIIHLISGLELGGAENQLFQFVIHSDSRQFKHIVISMLDAGHYGRKLQEHGITVYTLNMSRKKLSFLGLYRLWRIIISEKPNLLQTWLYHADLLGLIMGKCLGIPKIIWNIRCSNMQLNHYSFLTKMVIKACALFSFLPQAAIVNSKTGLKIHREMGYKIKNWFYIPNGLRTDYFKPDHRSKIEVRESLNIKSETLLIGMFARFDPMKDHNSFLLAAKQLGSLLESLDVQFILVGQGIDKSNNALMEKIVDLDLESRFHLLGPRKDIPELLNALDLLVLPSAFGEGFSNILGEAMACGIPCIASNVGDSAAIIGDTGRVVKPGDPDELAKVILEMLSLKKNQREVLGNLARQRIIENYGFVKMIQEYENTYRSLAIYEHG